MSTYDEQMMRIVDHALNRICAPHPTQRHMERLSDFGPSEQRRIIDHWLSRTGDRDAYVLDKLTEVKVGDLMNLYVAGDDLAIGQMISRLLASYGTRVDRDSSYWRTT